MRRTVVTLFALMSAIAVSPVATAANRSSDRSDLGLGAPPRFEAGRVLVGVEPGQRGLVRGLVRQRGGEVEEFQAPGGFFVVDVPGDAPAWAGAVRGGHGVRYAEPDYLVADQDLVPDDPRWGSQWDMRAVGAPAAWDVSSGSSDVTVAVIDTGIDLHHPDLIHNLWTNPSEIAGNGIDDDGNGWRDDVHGADCASNDGDPADDDGHGTHVAGTIGATGNDGVGIAGMNWDVGLMALDIFKPNGTAAVSDITQCIDYAIKMGVRLTNNSYGGADFSQAEYDAFQRARSAGLLMVAAAGNTGWNVDVTPLYPAAFDLDNIVSVAASDSNDALPWWSCYGRRSVDLAAPGVGVLSTWATNLYPEGYWAMDGTSMASPHVAGAAALILSLLPDATYPFLRNALLSSADPIPSLDGKVATGGRLNVAAALSMALSDGAPVAVAPIPGFRAAKAVAATGTTIDLRWSASDADGVASYEFQQSTNGGATYTPLTLSPVTATIRAQALKVNTPTYAFRVRATDRLGQAGAWAAAPPFVLRYVQESSPSIAYAGSWGTTPQDGALGGATDNAAAAGSVATISLGSGTQAFGLVFSRGNNRGKAEVWLDGSRRVVLDLFASSTQQRWLAFGASLDPTTPHVVEIRVLGQKRAAAKGTWVDLDAVASIGS